MGIITLGGEDVPGSEFVLYFHRQSLNYSENPNRLVLAESLSLACLCVFQHKVVEILRGHGLHVVHNNPREFCFRNDAAPAGAVERERKQF